MNLMDVVYELLKVDWEIGGRGLTSTSISERLLAEDSTLTSKSVEEVLFALMTQGFIETNGLPMDGGISAARWRIIPEWQEEMNRRQQKEAQSHAPQELLPTIVSPVTTEETLDLLKCPHCERSDSVVGQWCTRCMKRVNG
jgi:hypothetical protein